jgi:GNAT superfamily N-acetyltransferase
MHWKRLFMNIDTSELELIREAGKLLETEWPSQGGVEGRIKHICRFSEEDLPACFAAVVDGHVFGFISVRVASKVVGGLSAIAYSVVVAQMHRRSGVGRFLIVNAEDELRRLGQFSLPLYKRPTENLRKLWV